jgi:hypothetical protein
MVVWTRILGIIGLQDECKHALALLASERPTVNRKPTQKTEKAAEQRTVEVSV